MVFPLSLGETEMHSFGMVAGILLALSGAAVAQSAEPIIELHCDATRDGYTSNEFFITVRIDPVARIASLSFGRAENNRARPEVSAQPVQITDREYVITNRTSVMRIDRHNGSAQSLPHERTVVYRGREYPLARTTYQCRRNS
jgi:hypothetical protein